MPPKTSDRPDYSRTRIRRVNWATELGTVRRLFLEYREWLAGHSDPAAGPGSPSQVGLAQIDRLIAGLPGEYGPPGGEVLLAFAGRSLAACGALRGLEPKVGEIKRVYVRPDHRGPGFGPRLTRALLDRARQLGYERVRVDTLPTMAAAIQFYPAMGFKPIPPFWPHPVAGALFFEYPLKKPKLSASRRGVSKSRSSE